MSTNLALFTDSDFSAIWLLPTDLAPPAKPEKPTLQPLLVVGLPSAPAEFQFMMAQWQAYHEEPVVWLVNQPTKLPEAWPETWFVAIALPSSSDRGYLPISEGFVLDTSAQLTVLRKQSLLFKNVVVIADGRQILDAHHYAELILPFTTKVYWFYRHSQGAEKVEALLAEG